MSYGFFNYRTTVRMTIINWGLLCHFQHNSCCMANIFENQNDNERRHPRAKTEIILCLFAFGNIG